MKKIIFTIICIACSLTGLGQRLALSNSVSITQAKDMVELSRDKIYPFAKEKLHNKNLVPVDNTALRSYTVNNILISLHSENGKVKSEHLLELKQGFDAMSITNEAYKSQIVTVNNNQVLIILSGGGEYARYYEFICFNKAHTSAISGILQFNEADGDEAKSVLDNMLNSIKFAE